MYPCTHKHTCMQTVMCGMVDHWLSCCLFLFLSHFRWMLERYLVGCRHSGLLLYAWSLRTSLFLLQSLLSDRSWHRQLWSFYFRQQDNARDLYMLLTAFLCLSMMRPVFLAQLSGRKALGCSRENAYVVTFWTSCRGEEKRFTKSLNWMYWCLCQDLTFKALPRK